MEIPTRRKNIRLLRENYLGLRRYSVTICCTGRNKIFARPSKAEHLLDLLRTVAANQKFAVLAYCVMPDHLHLLVQAQEAQSDLLKFVRRFKQQTAYTMKSESGIQLWQRYFYDHILRPRDSAEAVAWYVWMNPVRKGLCAVPEEYPFSGSFTLDWKCTKQPEASWVPPWKEPSTATSTSPQEK